MKNDRLEKKFEELRKEVKRMIGVAIEHFEKYVAVVAEQYSDLREKIERLDERLEILEERMKAVEETLVEHSKILQEHSRILNEHSKILNEHSKILQEIRYELKTKVSYDEFIKLVNRVANLERKVQELSKKK